jgi:hypothetical protein
MSTATPRRAIAERRQGPSREALEQFLHQLAGWAGDDQVKNLFTGMAHAMLAERPKTGEEVLPLPNRARRADH